MVVVVGVCGGVAGSGGKYARGVVVGWEGKRMGNGYRLWLGKAGAGCHSMQPNSHAGAGIFMAR